jgi:hypothetical protein
VLELFGEVVSLSLETLGFWLEEVVAWATHTEAWVV